MIYRVLSISSTQSSFILLIYNGSVNHNLLQFVLPCTGKLLFAQTYGFA